MTRPQRGGRWQQILDGVQRGERKIVDLINPRICYFLQIFLKFELNSPATLPKSVTANKNCILSKCENFQKNDGSNCG